MAQAPNFRAHAAYRHRADTVRRPRVACTDGSREKLALMTSPAALKLANETACMYCKLDLRHTAVFAQLTPMDGRNVSTYLNLAPRYVLTGSFICGDCMISRNTFGIWLSFAPAYTAHTPNLRDWSIMRVYYPSEELRADGKYTMLPGKGEQRFLPKHLDLYYNVLGYSAQAMCKARNPEESGLMPAFLHLWHTARLHIQSLCKDKDLPCFEHDAKLVEPLTRYTEALAESLVKESAYKHVEALEAKLDPRVLVFVQQSAALTGQQNRQLAPLFLTRASSLLTQTLFPCPDGAAQEAAGLLETVQGLAQATQNLVSQALGLDGADRAKRNETTYLAPISVDVVRSHVLREFLTRAVRHFQTMNLRGFEDRDQLARHVMCAFGQRALSELRGVTLLLDLVDKYQFAFRQEFTTSKATLGYLRALHDSLQDVQDLRTMLCMNGDLGLLSDLDVAELLLEASQLQDGQSVSAESLDLGASAQKRYPTLDAIIARNIHARQEQERKAAELKEQLQARKAAAEAEQANLEKICLEEQKEEEEKKEEEQKEEGGEPIKSAAEEAGCNEALLARTLSPKETLEAKAERLYQELFYHNPAEPEAEATVDNNGIHRNGLPVVVQEYHRIVRQATHAYALEVHTQRLTLLQVFLDDESSTPFEAVLLLRAMSQHMAPRTFLKLVWRLASPTSKVWQFFQQKHALGEEWQREMAPRKFLKWGVQVKGSQGRAGGKKHPFHMFKHIKGKRQAQDMKAEVADQKVEADSEEVVEEELELLRYMEPEEGRLLAQSKRAELAKLETKLREDAESECPICFGELKSYYALPCSTASSPHAFCTDCLSAVAKADPVCPLCRAGFHLTSLKKLSHTDLAIIHDQVIKYRVQSFCNALGFHLHSLKKL
eukprot:g26857.t1